MNDDRDRDDAKLDSDDDFMDESDEEAETITCLFCPNTLTNIEDAIKHVGSEHNINFPKLKSKFKMDQYSFIKLINFIRCEETSPEKVQNAQQPFWLDEKYLKPKAYEPWLSYDYESLEDGVEDNVRAKEENSSLKELVQTQRDQLEQAAHHMTIMRNAFKRLLEKEVCPNNLKSGKENSLIKHDRGYFETYDHFGIHHEMLRDTARTLTYQEAFFKNRQSILGKDVLDVGCGTGILSIFASQAGANRVVGIDNSSIIHHAMDIVRVNNIKNIELVKGCLESVDLPQEKYDIVVSEWMGYFLMFEGMLDTIIYARDHYLKPDGILMPNRCTLSLMGHGDDDLYEDHINFWNNVYGLDMSTLRKESMHEALVELINPMHILTEAACIANFDLYKVDKSYSNFERNFDLLCIKDGTLSSFVGYFDIYFDLPERVMLSTSPNSTPTHWKQVVFFLEQPQSINKGDIIKCRICCKRSLKCSRSLTIDLEVFDKSFTYYLD